MRISLLYRLFAILVLAMATAAAGESKDSDAEAEPAPLGVDDIPLRIAKAEVGEWALYRNGEGGQTRLTVVEKWEDHGDTYLVIRSEVTKAKKKRGAVREETVIVEDAVADLRDLGPEDRVTAGELLVRKNKIDVVIVNFVSGGEVYRQSYFSDEVPVYGLVRGVNPKAKTKISLNLIDYGFAEDADD